MYLLEIRIAHVLQHTLPNPVVLTVPNAPTIVDVTHTDLSNCGVNDGTITVTATAGSSSVQYSNDGGSTWQNSNSFTALAAGTYDIRIRNSDGTCIVTGPSVVIDPKVQPIIASIVSTDPTRMWCF